MKKIYSKILLYSLVVLVGVKNLFTGKVFGALNVNPLIVDSWWVMAPSSSFSPIPSKIEQIINGMFYPVLFVSAFCLFVYVFYKIKKKDVIISNLLLITSVLGFILYLLLFIISYLATEHNYYDNFFKLILNKGDLVIAIITILFSLFFIYFLIRTAVIVITSINKTKTSKLKEEIDEL